MSDSRRFLVTGGAGFIGSHIVTALLQRGHRVVVLDDLSTGKRENLDAAIADAGEIAVAEGIAYPVDARVPDDAASPAERCDFREASLLDQDALANAVEGVDAVLHQAAIPSVPRSFADPVATMRANAEGTTSLLEACRNAGVRRIAIASSSSIYGNSATLPKEEDMVPSPMSPYALSKLTAEQAARIFAENYDLEVWALRYFNVFGPRQDPASQYSAVIPKFITMIAAGEKPVIYGDGLQSRDFTYIDNVVYANLLAVGAEAGAGEATNPDDVCSAGSCHVLNVACGNRFTLLDLIGALNEIMHTSVEPEFAEPQSGDVRHSHAAIGRARRRLGYVPLVEFEEGLRRTVASLRSDPETGA